MNDFSEPKFSFIKVFACSGMPEEIKSHFFNLGVDSNGSYIGWIVGMIDEQDPADLDPEIIHEYRTVDEWFISNGAAEEEQVLVAIEW